jgi:hypothetical protein
MLLCTAGFSAIADGHAAVAAVAAPDCTFVKTPSGLAFCDTKEGSGDAAQAGTLVRVHYDGRLESNGAKFDSSYDRGACMCCCTYLGDRTVHTPDCPSTVPAMHAQPPRTVSS